MEACFEAVPFTSRPAGKVDGLAEVVRRIATGEEWALEELYDQTSRRAYGLALGILKDPGLAEEATLDAYTRIWRQAASYDPKRGEVMTWILTIARSKAIDILRSRIRTRGRETGLDDEQPVADNAPDPEQASSDSQESDLIRHALDSLPAEQRQAIEAAFYSGLTHSEVAAMLQQPLGTVKTRIRTGLATLRTLLPEMEGYA